MQGVLSTVRGHVADGEDIWTAITRATSDADTQVSIIERLADLAASDIIDDYSSFGAIAPHLFVGDFEKRSPVAGLGLIDRLLYGKPKCHFCDRAAMGIYKFKYTFGGYGTPQPRCFTHLGFGTFVRVDEPKSGDMQVSAETVEEEARADLVRADAHLLAMARLDGHLPELTQAVIDQRTAWERCAKLGHAG